MLTQCSSSLPVSWFSMAIGAGKGWVLIQLLEKDSLEKVSVGLQGAECSFCKWGRGSSSCRDRGRQGSQGSRVVFFSQGKSQTTLLKWLGKRDKEGEDGCRGAGLAPCLGWGSVGTGEGWELPRATSHTPHTAHTAPWAGLGWSGGHQGPAGKGDPLILLSHAGPGQIPPL